MNRTEKADASGMTKEIAVAPLFAFSKFSKICADQTPFSVCPAGRTPPAVHGAPSLPGTPSLPLHAVVLPLADVNSEPPSLQPGLPFASVEAVTLVRFGPAPPPGPCGPPGPWAPCAPAGPAVPAAPG